MNTYFKFIFLAIYFSMGGFVLGQDLQYSQFNAMPIYLNPAFTGNSSCNYRVAAIHRRQWIGSNDFKSYESTSVAGDFNIGGNSNEMTNLWGVGLLANYDKTAYSTYTNQSLMASIAYHLRFGESGHHFLSFGIQGGVAQHKLGEGRYIFDNEIGFYGQVTPKVNIPTDVITYADVNFGAMATLNPDASTNIYIGASAFHLTRPNISFVGQEFNLPIRFNFHAGAQKAFADMYVMPSMYLQYQQVENWNAGTYFGKILRPETETQAPIVGYLGLWYKSNDAIAAAFRMDLGQLSVAFSYDIHTGKVSNSQGGLGSPELSISYFGCFGRNSRRTGCPSL